MKYTNASAYFCVRMGGGDERPVYTTPAVAVEVIRRLYPEAMEITSIPREEFNRLCERMRRIAA